MSMTRIKEIRTAAGMSQEALAKAAGVTIAELSKAERGIKDLTPEKLDAVAKALDAAPESLQDPAPAAGETATAKPVELTEEERELIDLYRTADADRRKMAVAILKGTMESRDYVNFLAGMLKGTDSAALMNAVKSMILGSKVEDLIAVAKNLMGKNGMGLMGGLTGMPGSGNTGEISVPLLAFTYFYSATIYILLLSFYFWLWRRDIRPEK